MVVKLMTFFHFHFTFTVKKKSKKENDNKGCSVARNCQNHETADNVYWNNSFKGGRRPRTDIWPGFNVSPNLIFSYFTKFYSF